MLNIISIAVSISYFILNNKIQSISRTVINSVSELINDSTNIMHYVSKNIMNEYDEFVGIVGNYKDDAITDKVSDNQNIAHTLDKEIKRFNKLK